MINLIGKQTIPEPPFYFSLSYSNPQGRLITYQIEEFDCSGHLTRISVAFTPTPATRFISPEGNDTDVSEKQCLRQYEAYTERYPEFEPTLINALSDALQNGCAPSIN